MISNFSIPKHSQLTVRVTVVWDSQEAGRRTQGLGCHSFQCKSVLFFSETAPMGGIALYLVLFITIQELFLWLQYLKYIVVVHRSVFSPLFFRSVLAPIKALRTSMETRVAFLVLYASIDSCYPYCVQH